MKSWAYHHRLCICNLEIEQDWRNSWTFLSSLGRERRIDYIMTDYTLHLIDARASNILNLNSDHRAVKASFEVIPQENAQISHKSYHNSPRKWLPKFNENREPQEYHDCLNRYFALHEMQSLHDVEVAIQSCAQVCNTTENQTESKPWLNSEIRHLINERRCTRDSRRRKEISLQLKRTWRREKRKFQNREFDKIIDEFKNLDRLQVVHETSIRKTMPKVSSHD